MLETVKLLAKKYYVLIIILIVLLIGFLLYKVIFGEQSYTNRVRGGSPDYTSYRFYIQIEDERFLYNVIGSKTDDFEYNNGRYSMFVLNDTGIEKLQNRYASLVNSFYLTYLQSFYTQRESIINLMIKNPLGKFADLERTALRYGGTTFNFAEVVSPLNVPQGPRELTNPVLDSYSLLFDTVVSKFPESFDYVSFIGQPAHYPLPLGSRIYPFSDLTLSGTKDTLFKDVPIFNLLFDSINNPKIIRSWFTQDVNVKRQITGEYYSEGNGLIFERSDNDAQVLVGSINNEVDSIAKTVKDIIEEMEGKYSLKEQYKGKCAEKRFSDLPTPISILDFTEYYRRKHNKFLRAIEKKTCGMSLIPNLKADVENLEYEFASIGQWEWLVLNPGLPDAREGLTVAPPQAPPSGTYQVADIYPAYKMAITIMFFISVYPIFVDQYDAETYLKMISAYVLSVNSFNINCNVRMNPSWNEGISNQYVYEKNPNVQSPEESDMELSCEVLARCNETCILKYILDLNEKYPGTNTRDSLAKALTKASIGLGEDSFGYVKGAAMRLGVDLDSIRVLPNSVDVYGKITDLKGRMENARSEYEKAACKILIIYIREEIFYPKERIELSSADSQDLEIVQRGNGENDQNDNDEQGGGEGNSDNDGQLGPPRASNLLHGIINDFEEKKVAKNQLKNKNNSSAADMSGKVKEFNSSRKEPFLAPPLQGIMANICAIWGGILTKKPGLFPSYIDLYNLYRDDKPQIRELVNAFNVNNILEIVDGIINISETPEQT